MNLHCDWSVELLRWLMGWAGYLQKVPDTLTKLSFLWEQWKLTLCSGPFFGRRNNTNWILEVTRTSRMHKNSLQAGTYQNTSLACLNNFFIFFLSL